MALVFRNCSKPEVIEEVRKRSAGDGRHDSSCDFDCDSEGVLQQGVRGDRLPVLQGVWGAQRPSIAGGAGGAAPQYCRGSGGRSSPVLKGVWGAQPPTYAEGPGGAAPRKSRVAWRAARPPNSKNTMVKKIPWYLQLNTP